MARHRDLIVIAVTSFVGVLCAVVVSVENAGIAITSQQNHRIRERFEPRLDDGFKRLQWLRIMVRNERHRKLGSLVDQTSVEYFSQVEPIARLACV